MNCLKTMSENIFAMCIMCIIKFYPDGDSSLLRNTINDVIFKFE